MVVFWSSLKGAFVIWISQDLAQDFYLNEAISWAAICQPLFFFFGLILQQVAIYSPTGSNIYKAWFQNLYTVTFKKNAASYKFLFRAASMAFWFEVVEITVLTKIDGVSEKTKSSGFICIKNR